MPNLFKITYQDVEIKSESLNHIRKVACELIRTSIYKTSKIASLPIINGQTEFATVRVSWKKTKGYQYWYFPVKTTGKIHYYRLNEDGTIRYSIDRK